MVIDGPLVRDESTRSPVTRLRDLRSKVDEGGLTDAERDEALALLIDARIGPPRR